MKKIGNKNIAPKVISILFSLVLWIYVTGTNPDAFRNITNVPVQLVNIEEIRRNGLAIKGSDDFRVRIRLTGKRDEVYNVSSDEIQIRADLKGCKAGVNNIPLEITVLDNVEVDVIPRSISVELEKIISKQKEVKIITTGTPEKDFIVGNLQYKPKMVEVEGPESYVNLVESVVAKLDVTRATENLAWNLPLKPVNSKNEEVPNVDVKISNVNVSLSVDLLKSVPVKPDLQVTTEAGYDVTDVKISPMDVVLRGQKELINDIIEVITEPIKFENLNQDKTLNVRLNLPEGVTLHKNVPITVDLRLEKVEEATYKISRDEIIFNNIDEKLKVDTSSIPENIDVRVVASRDVLDSIKEDDIKTEVDLSGLDANKYTIELVAQLPFTIEKNIKELHLNPKTIDIELIDK